MGLTHIYENGSICITGNCVLTEIGINDAIIVEVIRNEI